MKPIERKLKVGEAYWIDGYMCEICEDQYVNEREAKEFVKVMLLKYDNKKIGKYRYKFRNARRVSEAEIFQLRLEK